MTAAHIAHGIWSPIEGLLQWWRDWREAGSELKYCGEEGVERIAHDAGMSAGEFRDLASHGPHAADLLLERMAALDLDRQEVAQVEPQVLRDLQRVCSMCECHGRCARELRRDPNDPAWKNYCPNVETLTELNALPWSSRREW